MKKTLVALAVLAASGASFAQVTITGELAYGYLMTSTSGVDASGLGIDTANVVLTSVEDLGGGTKLTGTAALKNTDDDFSIALATAGAGKLTLARTKGADYLSGGIAGVGNAGLDGKITSARASNDFVSYSFPVTSAISLGFTHVEDAKVGGIALTGIGAGATGNGAEQRRNLVSADFNSGAIKANLGFGAYDSYGDVATSYKSILRAAASYDFGVVQLGLGIDNRNYVTGTRTDTLIGLHTSMGALSGGISAASRKYDSTNDVTKDGTRSGYSVRVGYALSKRTGVYMDYQNYKAKLADDSNSSSTELYIDHTF
jgi:hypothetical protein